MKIPRCRFWRCPECQALHEKKSLADYLRRQREGEEVSFPGKCRCSRCATTTRAADVYAGEFDVPREQWGRLPQPVEVEDVEWAVLDEEDDKDEAEDTERRRRRHLIRYRAFKKVNIGLAIHYGGMATFLLGLVLGWMSLVIFVVAGVMQGAYEENDPARLAPVAASALLFVVSWGLTSLSSLADLVSAAFCLATPDETARKFLVTSLVVRLLAAPSGLLLLLVGWSGVAALATIFLVVVGWLLWVGFLWRLSDCLNYAYLGEWAVGVTLSAFYLILTWVIGTSLMFGFFIFALLLLACIGGSAMCFSPLAMAGLIAGIIKYLLASGKFETLPTLVLYPTGIPLVMRYLDLIGTTRMMILRRL